MGHYPAAIFFPLFRKSRAALITNIDGLCWMRSKWSKPVQRFILRCEKTAIRLSHALIADHPAIQSYCMEQYQRRAHHIAYGAVIPTRNDTTQLSLLGLQAQAYYLLVSRLEPENNIDMILEGYLKSACLLPFIVVGSAETQHGRYLVNKYRHAPHIRFVGTIFDYEALSGLRRHCKIYFHGHSVGGTTPSLLEAMACEAYISAHDNRFNRGILEQDAVYFSNPDDIARQIQQEPRDTQTCLSRNLDKIRQRYDWDRIANQHEDLFHEVLTLRRGTS